MHLSVDTKVVDNGFILDIVASGILFGNPKKESLVSHEVYRDWPELKHRIQDTLEQIVFELKEGIPEKVR